MSERAREGPGGLGFLAGGGEMGERVRSFEWSRTAVGAIERWPPSLRAAAGICLHSRFPILLWVGPDLQMLYNDACRPVIGGKHPRALGSPGREVWPEIWPLIGPRLAAVARDGRSTWSDDELLLLERHGYLEETFFTYSYSPIWSDVAAGGAGGVVGVFTAVSETTSRVVGERRLSTLRELAARAAPARTTLDAARGAVEALAANPVDVPFALLYVVSDDGREARLGAATLPPESRASPAVVPVNGAGREEGWPLAEVARTGVARSVTDLVERFGRLPSPRPVPPRRAELLPLRVAGRERVAGVLVLGVDPCRELDEAHRGFHELVAGHVVAALSSAGAYEQERRRLSALVQMARVRRETEDALRESEERYRRLVALLPVAVYTCRAPDGEITFYNRKAAELWGRAPALGAEEGPFCGATRTWNEDGSPLAREETPMAVAVREGQSFRNRAVVVERPDGTRVPVLVDVDPIRDAHGRLVGAISAFQDASEHEHAEDARRRLASIVESSADAILSLDLDGTITSWNRGAELLYGYDAEEVVGRPISLLIPEDHTEDFPTIVERLRRGERVEHYETVRLTRDGRRVDVSLTVSPLRDAAGTVVGASKSARDVTERKRAEALRLEYERALVEAARRKDEFLATLAHELRNPLAPLRTGLHVLELVRGDAERFEECRSMMERQLAQLARLVDDLMDVSRITRGRIDLDLKRVDLSSVVRHAIETSAPLLAAGGQELAVELPDEPVHVEGDEVRLAQVLGNLLNNAAKYSEPGGRVGVRVRREGDEALVAVRDTGAGIPPDMLTSIFEMFTQVDRSAERRRGGLGIGLTLVKRLVELHGGTVEARSTGQGHGSEFVVRLPALGADARDPAAAGAARPSAPARRVLVVDDNRDAADSLALMLRLEGHDARTAYDGVEAVEAAAEFRPELILLDLGMPRRNGYDAAAAIRREPWGRDVVIAALSGWGQEDVKRRSAEAGFDLHLVKPVDLGLLAGVLARPRRARGSSHPPAARP